MLRLGVATQAETFERMRDPLADRGIGVVGLDVAERTFDLAAPDLPAVDVGFVFPGRLMEGGVVDAALDVPWVNGRDAVIRSRNKAEALSRLRAAGVPTPATTMVSNPTDEDRVAAAAERIGYPLVVKPNSTTRGIGVAKADDPDTLSGVVDYLDLVHDYRATGDKSFLLQEYVADARDYRVMVIDGEYVGAVERRLPEDALAAGRWKHNVHRGATATRVDLPDEARDRAERAAAALSVDYLGVDLLAAESSVRVLETGARPTIDSASKYESDFYDRLAALIERTAAEN